MNDSNVKCHLSTFLISGLQREDIQHENMAWSDYNFERKMQPVIEGIGITVQDAKLRLDKLGLRPADLHSLITTGQLVLFRMQ